MHRIQCIAYSSLNKMHTENNKLTLKIHCSQQNMKYKTKLKLIEYKANHTVLGIQSIKYNAYNSKQKLCILCIKYNA